MWWCYNDKILIWWLLAAFVLQAVSEKLKFLILIFISLIVLGIVYFSSLKFLSKSNPVRDYSRLTVLPLRPLLPFFPTSIWPETNPMLSVLLFLLYSLLHTIQPFTPFTSTLSEPHNLECMLKPWLLFLQIDIIPIISSFMFCTSSSGSSISYFKCQESAEKITLMFMHLSITQLPSLLTITHLVTAELYCSLNNI